MTVLCRRGRLLDLQQLRRRLGPGARRVVTTAGGLRLASHKEENRTARGNREADSQRLAAVLQMWLRIMTGAAVDGGQGGGAPACCMAVADVGPLPVSRSLLLAVRVLPLLGSQLIDLSSEPGHFILRLLRPAWRLMLAAAHHHPHHRNHR
jgi:hypothetical protein